MRGAKKIVHVQRKAVLDKNPQGYFDLGPFSWIGGVALTGRGYLGGGQTFTGFGHERVENHRRQWIRIGGWFKPMW